MALVTLPMVGEERKLGVEEVEISAKTVERKGARLAMS